MNMQRLMAVEFFKLRKRMMTWVVALLLVGLVILLYSVLWNISGRVAFFGDHHRGAPRFTGEDLRRALFLQGAVPFSLAIVTTFGTLLAVILAAGAIGSEYAWGTVRLMATASSGRLRMMAARMIVVALLVAAGTLLAVAVAVTYSTIITVVSGGADFSFITAGWAKEQLFAYGRTLFVMAPYVALAFAAATVGRSTLAGVGTGMGAAFLEPLVSNLMRLGGNPWKSIPNYLINSNAQVITLQNVVPEPLPRFGPTAADLAGQGVHSPAAAAVILALYVVAFIAIAFVVYRRRDIAAGGGG
ncbi:MAG TPA: ABC transporter permease [Dehalococcoidia bacterium]|nr:ABC transporter permease [Dehalococcoidia bacterium]